MARLADIVAKQIDQSFTNIFGKEGFTESIIFKFFQTAGEYDAETDTQADVFNDITVKDVIVAKPSSDDMKEHQEVVATDAKLIVPGLKLPAAPEVDTDKVMRGGLEWDVRKTVGVPGDAVILVFIYLT